MSENFDELGELGDKIKKIIVFSMILAMIYFFIKHIFFFRYNDRC